MAQKARVRRQRPLCWMCEEVDRVRLGVELDHKVALTNGGTNEDENMGLLCIDCHKAKTAVDLGYQPRGCDVRGDPTDPRHHWN